VWLEGLMPACSLKFGRQRTMPDMSEQAAEVTVRCGPCSRRRGHLRHAPAMIVLVRKPIVGVPGRYLWLVRQAARMAVARQAPAGIGNVIDGTASLHAPRGGVELRCRACGHRPRVRVRVLYTAADQAVSEGRDEIYV
jgi:hypothetical protein